MAKIHTILLTLFLVTIFFLELQNIHKKERIDGIPVQNLPLFTAALMSKKNLGQLQIASVKSSEIGIAT